jgi:hypothetical protein
MQSPNPPEEDISSIAHYYKTKDITKTKFEIIADWKLNWVMAILEARHKFGCENHDKISNLGGYIEVIIPGSHI